MPNNPNLLAALQDLATPEQPPPAPSSGVGGIVASDLANIIPRAVNSLGASVEGVANFFGDPATPPIQLPEMPNFAKEPAVNPSSGLEKMTHILLGGVAPEIAALMMPYLGVSKLAKIGGMGQLGQVVSGNVAQGAVGGIKYGPEEALEGAAFGGALSGIGALPKFSQRILPALGAAGTAAALNPEQANTAFAMTAVGGFLPSMPRQLSPSGRMAQAIPEAVPSPTGLSTFDLKEALAGVQFQQTPPATPMFGPTRANMLQIPEELSLSSGLTSSERFSNFVNTNAPNVEPLGPTHNLALAQEPSLPSGQVINDLELPVIGTSRVSMDEFAQAVSGRRPMPIHFVEWNLPEVALRQGILESNIRPTKMIQPSGSAEGGFTSPEIISSIGGGVAGAITGNVISEGDPMATAAGALLGAGGGAALGGSLSSPNIRAKVLQNKIEVGNALAVAQASPALRETLQVAAKDLTQANTYGQGGGLSKVFDFIDKQFRVSMSPEEKTAITKARGDVSLLAERAVAYLKPYLDDPTSINPIIQDKANRYLDGLSVSATDEMNFLRAAGAIDDPAYESLSPQARKGLTTWRVGEDFASPTVGFKKAFDMHVPVNKLDNLKDTWNAKLTQGFLSSVSADERPFADAIVKARTNFNEIQRMFSRALPAGPTQQLVTESVGRYVPRLFRAFTDPKYKITDEMVQNYIQEFGLNRRGGIFQSAVATGQAYDASLYQTLLSKAPQGSPQYQRLSGYVPYQLDGRTIHTTPQMAAQLAAAENPVHLTNLIRQHLQELTAGEVVGGSKGGAGLDPTLFQKREDLTSGYRKLLGEYTNPVERMAMAFSRTYAPAQAASLMDVAKNIQLPNGIRTAYDPATWSSEIQKALASGDNSKIQALQQMKLLGKSAVFGEYAGNYVSRHLADYFEGGSQIWNQSIGRSIAEFNKFFKTGHVPLNPISHVRQIVSMPAFLAIGRAAPEDMKLAYQAMTTAAREEGTMAALIRDELLKVGAWTSDLIKGELQGNLDTLLSGKYDSDISKFAKGAVNKVLEAYRKPDMLVRAATYLGEKRRSLEAGLSEQAARQQALEWMDRYTMNYDNIAPAVRFLRNVPGVSPFLSYQSEMLRLTKNMLADGLKGNVERLGTLAGITAIPLGVAAVGEQSLSSSDKKDWERTKSLMPDYQQGKILVPTGKNPNGSWKYWDISPDVAHSDLIKLVKNVASGRADVAVEQNPFVSTTASPILQALAKITTQRDVRTGAEYSGAGETALSAISDILPPITPGVGYEWTRLANVNVENLYTGKKESWGDWATRLVTGASPSSIKTNVLLAGLKKEFDRSAANERSKYLKVAKLQGEGLESRKLDAYNTYRANMAETLEEFRSRLTQANQS